MARGHVGTAGFTSQGRRGVNEDAYAITSLTGGRWAVCVADGMGGHSYGRVASEAAVAAFRCAVTTTASTDRDALEYAFACAAEAVAAKTRELDSEDLGTTFIGAIVDSDGSGWVAHVGDSAAILVTRNGVRRVTVDHSFVAEQMQLGKMTEIESYTHPLRNAITRALGTAAVVPDLNELAVDEPAVLIVATDGVLKFVADAEIAEIVSNALDADSAVRHLVLRAIRNGGDDNATAVAVTMSAWTWQKPRRGSRTVFVLALLTVLLFVVLGALIFREQQRLRGAARRSKPSPAQHHARPAPPERRGR